MNPRFFPYKKWMGSTHWVWPQGLRSRSRTFQEGSFPRVSLRYKTSTFGQTDTWEGARNASPKRIQFQGMGVTDRVFFRYRFEKKNADFVKVFCQTIFLDQEHLLSLVGMEVANSCREGWGNHWRCGEKDLKGHGELSGKYRYYSNCLVVDLVAKESLFLFNLGLCVPNQTWLDLSTSVLMAQFSSVNLLSRMLIQGGHLPVRSRVIAIKLYL